MKKRILAWLLTLLMVLSLTAPIGSARAEEGQNPDGQVEESQGDETLNEGEEGGEDPGEEYPDGEDPFEDDDPFGIKEDEIPDEEEPLLWEEAFPDPVFRKFVAWKVHSDGVGEITDAEFQEMRAAEFVNISTTYCSEEALPYAPVQPDEKIQTMAGIEYFPNITSLECSGRGVEELDVRYNRHLQFLKCVDNSIQELDLSLNSDLVYVYCYGNDGITIDLGVNTPLVKGYAEYLCWNIGVDEDGYCHSRITRDDGVGSLVYSPENTTIIYNEELFYELRDEAMGILMDPAEMFPDENFRKVVLWSYDSDHDGKINASELAYISEYDLGLDVSKNAFSDWDNKPIEDTDLIKDLTGIEYFENAVSLDCSGRGVETLDISDNRALVYLFASDNAISELDLSNNLALRTVRCENNENLTINLGSNAVLIQCYANFLNDGGQADEEGVCAGYIWEDYSAVAELQFSEGTVINCDPVLLAEYLRDPWDDIWYYLVSEYDEDESGKLSEEEIQKITELTIHSYWYFEPTTLDGIERFTELQSLTIEGKYLEEIDLSKNVKLEKLDLNGITGATELDLSGLSAITELSLVNCEFSSINISGLTALQKLYINEDEATLEGIEGLDTAVSLTELVLMNTAIESLDVSELTALEKMTVFGSASLQTITGLENADNLVELEASRSGLISLDVSGMESLETLKCFECESMASLNIGANSIKTLVFGANGLSEVTGWDQITNVVYLDCRSNPLQSIDVSGYTNLEYLLCSGCGLSELNVASNTKLKYLQCQNNKINTLDISNNPDLFYLECYKNEITSLDIQSNPALLSAARGVRIEELYDESPVIVYEGGAGGIDYFNEWGIEAKTLSIDASVELVQGNNELSEEELADRAKFPDPKFYLHVLLVADANYNGVLDSAEWEIIANTKSLYPQNLGIKSLEGLQYFEGLEELGCDGNEITELDLSQNPNLKSVTCTDNLITELDVTGHNVLIRAVWVGPVPYSSEFVGLDGQSVIKEKIQYNVLKDYGWGPDFFFAICCDPEVNVYFDSSFEPDILQQFPDPVFREYVLYTYDNDGNLILDTEELEAIADAEKMDVRGLGIENMTGLGYFTGLTELDCSLNYLTALDISNNTLLATLFCYGNFFDTLDISNNPELVALIDNGHSEYDEEDYIREELYTSIPGYVPVVAYYFSDDSHSLIVDRFTDLVDGVTRPKFKDVGMNLSNVIGLRFRVNIPEELVKENVEMNFSDENGTLLGFSSIGEAEYEGEGNYIFTFYLNPLQFSDVITADLSYDDYNKIITCNYSAEQYCDELMAVPENYANTELRNLVEALRMYAVCNTAATWSDTTGHVGTYLKEGQTYWGEYTDAEMIASVLEGLGDEAGMQVDVGTTELSDVMISLTLKEDTTINLYVRPGAPSITAFVGSFKIVNGLDYFVFRGENKGPAALGEATVFEIQTTAGTATVTASPMSYVASYLNAFGQNESKIDNCRAMIALYQYYRAAQAYNNALKN